MNFNINNLTPVEKYVDLYFKRDDLFKPYPFSNINGGKLRQAIALLESKKDLIYSDYKSTIITSSSVHSPQGLIITTAAKQFKMRSIICIGGLRAVSQINNHSLLIKCKELGADVRLVCRHGMNNALFSKCQQIAQSEGGFIIRFGINYEDCPDIINAVAMQVKNLPDNLYSLIIPCGSGLTMSSILIGLQRYKKKVNNIIGIGVGPNRRDSIDKILNKYNVKLNYDFISLYGMKGYDYSKIFNEHFCQIEFDSIYEAKAYRFAKKNNFFKKDTLFWIVGNANLCR